MQPRETLAAISRSATRGLGAFRASLASPERSPRMAVVLGRLLGLAFLVCFATGLYSHFLQDPLPWMVFPTRPVQLYQWTQGLHITAGIVCFPLILGKLHVVYPALFQTPPVRSFPHLLERASIALFVASSLVQIVIGFINTVQWYQLFPFPFRQTHYALSFVVIGSLAVHIGVKLPVILQHWRKRPTARPSEANGVTGRVHRWMDGSGTTTRRAFLGTVGAGSAVVVLTTAGQSFAPLQALNLFAPRDPRVGPQGLPINRTAEEAEVVQLAESAGWTLSVVAGTRRIVLDRDALRALDQRTVDLPIACVEGWSRMATWTGVRLSDLLDLVEAPTDARIRAVSLETNSSYGVSEIGPEFARDELTLVALELNGDELDIDHGYPARIISPGRPGVLQTKWLSRLEVIA